MLILTRRVGETLIIGNGINKIIVTMLDVTGKQAKVGITAPIDIKIYRNEVYERIFKEIVDPFDAGNVHNIQTNSFDSNKEMSRE